MRAVRRVLAAALVVAAGCAGGPGSGSPDPGFGTSPGDAYDLVIEGGRVVDGTGAAWFYGDVGVRGDRIAAVTPAGMLADAQAAERIDASGMVVAPGFIDIQSHSRDAFLGGDGRVVSKVTQGITTEIMGEGWTNAPANALTLAGSGDITDPELQELSRSFVGPGGFDRWLRAMHENGVSPNIGSFAGATTLRVYGRGQEMGPATAAQLDSMKKAMRWAMEEGAFGLASALIYPPGNFASAREIAEVAAVMAPYGGVYITHMRSEADQVLEAIDEAVEIGERAGVPVEIYHLKAMGQRNWHKMPAMIDRIDAARARGRDVQANMYPYVAGGTGLSACLPPWASEGGELYDRIADPGERARIRAEVLGDEPKDWEDLCTLSSPEGVLLMGLDQPENHRWRGMRLSEVAEATGQHWVDVVLDLLESERQRIGTVYFFMSEENIARKLRQPWIKFGTDAGGFDPETAEVLTHPRAYGTFPRILGKYVREEGVIPLEEAVRKMTSAVTTRLSMQDRGVLREGMIADVVVFDPDRVGDRATFDEPHQLSVGVEHVFVNGTAVVRGGRHTGATPGRIVRGPGWTGGPR